MIKRHWYFAGLFLICMSTLMLQVIQTRILSVVSMYYLAFLSISMAMLGMTMGALFVYFKLGRITPANVASYLSRVSSGFAVLILLCFLLQLASPLPMGKVFTVLVAWLKVVILLAAPFTAAGVAVSLALTRSPFPVGITYGVDLCGAALGCLAAPLLMSFVDAPSAMFFVAALVALAGLCFRAAQGEIAPHDSLPDWRVLRRPGLIAAVIILLAAANAITRHGFQPISAKGGTIRIGANYEFEKWNSFSLVTATRNNKSMPFFWGRSPAYAGGVALQQRSLDIDGFAGTIMPRYAENPAAIDFLKYDITNLAYAARPNGRVAIIGVGSGRDLLSAHVFGSRDITGVELNPIFIDLLTDPNKLRGYAGIADLPGVRLIVDEGRSWFTRTQEKFDLIQMSMIDTFAATGAGAFSLSENALYTVEGWRIFLSALNPTGLFTVSRWHAPSAPVEMGRVTSLAVASLISLGIENPREHIFMASVGNLATLVVSRQPFSEADLGALTHAAERLRFGVIASPDRVSTVPVLEDVLSATSVDDLNERASNYWLDVSPPTDARPFFFNQLRAFNLLNLKLFADEYNRKGTFAVGENLVVAGNLAAMGTLFLLILLSLLAVVVAIILPARSSIHQVRRRLSLVGSAYFLLIGLGFMFIEIGLIQRISVFLGNPIYALSVVLFSIILSAGLGSLLSEALRPVRSAIVLWLSLLVLYLLALPHWLPALMHSSLESAGLVVRSLVSVAAILPAGLLMGFGFPFGMRLVTNWDARAIPWFWGINGAAGVLAAGIAVFCSIAFSIDTTIRIGGICYLLLMPAALLLIVAPRAASK